jgi:OFA family oxalate/formate antiporter-like MFS transporter
MEEATELRPAAEERVPKKAWNVVVAAIAVNLGLGILYAWSVWAKTLVPVDLAKTGQLITVGPAAGWQYLTNAQAATPFSMCVIIFGVMVLLGGRLHDKRGPRIGPVVGGLVLALGCIIAGLAKSYLGLIIGFGIMGGLGLGLAQSATVPPALQWFGPRQRGLVAGLIVGSYAISGLYLAPLTAYLIKVGGLSFSWIFLGLLFGMVVVVAGTFLAWPQAGYLVPAAPPAMMVDLRPGQMLGTWQFYVLLLMFIGARQAGLLIISNTAGSLATVGKTIPFLAAHAWIWVFFAPLIVVCGGLGTGIYSDNLGRKSAFALNCLLAAACLLVLPSIIASRNLLLLFLAVGLAYWVDGGLRALIPAYAADFYGTKNLGLNYPLLAVGFGGGFLMARLYGSIKDWTGSLSYVFIVSALVLIIVVILALLNRRPAMTDLVISEGNEKDRSP